MSPLIQLHFLVLIFASTAVLGRLISLPAPMLVVWRTALAAIGAVLFVILIRRKSVRVDARRCIQLLGIGGIVGLHWVAFFGSIQLSNISICLAGMATTSLFTAFTEPLLERRPVKGLEVALGMLVVAGVALVAGFERGHWTGLGVGMISAFLASIFPVLNRRVISRSGLDPQTMVAWEMLGANLVVLALLPVLSGHLADPGAAYRGLLDLKGADAFWILVLAWACTVFAHGFHIHLLRHLSAYTSNLAINFEPVYGILAAALLFGEYRDLHPGFYAGTLAILAANLLHALIPKWRAARRGE